LKADAQETGACGGSRLNKFKGYRKLIDIQGSQRYADLRFQLAKHKIPHRTAWIGMGGRARRRVFVETQNFGLALTITQALDVASTDPPPEIPAPSTARPEQSSGSELKVDFDRFTGKGRKR